MDYEQYKGLPMEVLESRYKRAKQRLANAQQEHDALESARIFTKYGFWPGDRVMYRGDEYEVSSADRYWLKGRRVKKDGALSMNEKHFYSDELSTRKS